MAADKPRIMLRSGVELDFLDPASCDFTIEDIAHGLSMLCRYAGQCRDFYSVAEHCLYVSDAVPEHAFAALMHDAAEAFVGDITRPLKQMLPQYKAIELAVEEAIFIRYGVPRPMPRAVKQADLAVLAAEQAQLMPAGTDRWVRAAGIRPARIRVACMPPAEAKAAFLERFEALHGRTVDRLTEVA
ncbi:hypothetical protein [Methylobacterium sp. Leaf469]|uniref:hypothetical protein n=1 Tax=Methylobacterium sp. Leaf469 TaxID=1736387 RepID=UPI001FCD0226|nr:hypothetical protein [Methylobacterium sp. Leaf469]